MTTRAPRSAGLPASTCPLCAGPTRRLALDTGGVLIVCAACPRVTVAPRADAYPRSSGDRYELEDA